MVNQIDTFDLSTISGSPATANLPFKSFNALGISGELTGVTVNLNSTVSVFVGSATTSVEIFGTPFPSTPNPVPFSGSLGSQGNAFSLNGVSGSATLADYINSNFDAVVTLTSGSVVSWDASILGESLTVSYTYTPTPLPATLPLFVGGRFTTKSSESYKKLQFSIEDIRAAHRDCNVLFYRIRRIFLPVPPNEDDPSVLQAIREPWKYRHRPSVKTDFP
jgi:hypothetical protein